VGTSSIATSSRAAHCHRSGYRRRRASDPQQLAHQKPASTPARARSAADRWRPRGHLGQLMIRREIPRHRLASGGGQFSARHSPAHLGFGPGDDRAADKTPPAVPLDAVVDALQPVIEPTHRLVAPFDARPVDARVREIVVPGPHPGMHRAGTARACARCCCGSRPAVLRSESRVSGCPASGAGARAKKPRLADVGSNPKTRVSSPCASRACPRPGEIRRAAPALIEVHGYLEFIDVHDAIHVVDVFGEQRLGGCDRENRLQRGCRRMAI